MTKTKLKINETKYLHTFFKSIIFSLVFCLIDVVLYAEAISLNQKVEEIINQYCLECHDEETQKAGVYFENLKDLALDSRLVLLNRMQEQVYIKEMPPRKKRNQPSGSERELLLSWLNRELKKHNASELEDKMRYPNYGNYIDHQKLFSGEIKEKAYTAARRWLVSPQIFNNRVRNIFKGHLDGYTGYGITNPIILPDHAGVRYYDNMLLDGGQLLIMLNNANWIVSKQVHAARIEKGDFKKGDVLNPKDDWYPLETKKAFKKIILQKRMPTSVEMTEAIQTQFSSVLGRKANADELKKYSEHLISCIEIGGNTKGLMQMLRNVILESEFMYRLEFGAGKSDSMGRKKLSAREASYAIAYALSDTGPDDALVKAAQKKKLLHKKDYYREVLRILNDKKSFFGYGSPILNGKNLKSHKVSHPKINRFFREFFGYDKMIKVFKDKPRSGGFYQNTGRGTAGTAGRVIDEADRVVDKILIEDKQVFSNLLGTENFFVYHDVSNREGARIVKEWKEVYYKYKDTDWRKNEDRIASAYDFLRPIRLRKGRGVHDNTLFRFMKYMDNTIGKNKTPFTVFPWKHGYSFRHSEIYNLPKLPSHRYFNELSWDYPLTQPFKLPHRKGILTHPAWLVAHSQNANTDPVVRGRWIREKLLAGRVPDIPITVDAVVPEDPHKTLRERFVKATHKQACMKCHERMNPLGYAFEMYDDFGRYRKKEKLEHEDNIIAVSKDKNKAPTYKTAEVNTKGYLSGTGNPKLDGEVEDAIDMITRLTQSKRVRQSIIRHAFRYFMGRNEMLSDSQTLIDADNAYVKNGGSFKAVVISLLTSDSFMYRKTILE